MEASNSNSNTKEQLINNIKEWINVDNEITQIKKNLKEKNKTYKELTDKLVTIMKTNKIDCFDIKGGSIIYKEKSKKKPLSKKSLLAALNDYYKNQPNMVEELTKHIMESRETKMEEKIARKIDK